MTAIFYKRILPFAIYLLFITFTTHAAPATGMISGKVLSMDGEPLDYVTVLLKGTSYNCSTNEKGMYHLKAPTGEYVLVVSSVGYERREIPVNIKANERVRLTVKLKSNTNLAEVIVVGNQLSKVKNSAFNATAVNTQELVNTTKTLSEALSKAPGMK
ncbi:MAG: carboxypeptidase-like regulatory domain-containing protein, partial [Muribaculaceae bacterium]|nr:carboxypeptidase-like regulatory domain-containing protein [Muribaculaceae bacterium]